MVRAENSKNTGVSGEGASKRYRCAIIPRVTPLGNTSDTSLEPQGLKDSSSVPITTWPRIVRKAGAFGAAVSLAMESCRAVLSLAVSLADESRMMAKGEPGATAGRPVSASCPPHAIAKATAKKVPRLSLIRRIVIVGVSGDEGLSSGLRVSRPSPSFLASRLRQ